MRGKNWFGAFAIVTLVVLAVSLATAVPSVYSAGDNSLFSLFFVPSQGKLGLKYPDAVYRLDKLVARPDEVTIMKAEVAPGGVLVTADPSTAGSASRVTVRFTTGGERRPGDEDDEITVTLPVFGVPASIDNDGRDHQRRQRPSRWRPT